MIALSTYERVKVSIAPINDVFIAYYYNFIFRQMEYTHTHIIIRPFEGFVCKLRYGCAPTHTFTDKNQVDCGGHTNDKGEGRSALSQQ